MCRMSCAVIIICVYVPPPSTRLPRLIFNECFIIDFGHGNTISLVHRNIHILIRTWLRSFVVSAGILTDS